MLKVILCVLAQARVFAVSGDMAAIRLWMIKSNALFTHMIDTNLHLKTICSFPKRTNHHTSIVDEDVELGLSCLNHMNKK